MTTAQMELLLHNVAMVDDQIITRQSSLTRAIVVCADIGGMEDKQAADAAGLDPATWSKIKSGQANFPHSRITQYQQRCGNWLPLQWQARDAGFGLVRLETTLERQLREEREARIRAEEKLAYAESLLTGKK